MCLCTSLRSWLRAKPAENFQIGCLELVPLARARFDSWPVKHTSQLVGLNSCGQLVGCQLVGLNSCGYTCVHVHAPHWTGQRDQSSPVPRLPEPSLPAAGPPAPAPGQLAPLLALGLVVGAGVGARAADTWT
eukprot:358386-Chlamydomonas_euryale.AAC.2